MLMTSLLAIVFMSSVIGPVRAADISVVCTNSALADFAGELLGDNADVEYVMPAGVCPALFDTRPSDVNMIASTDVIISLGWEPWLSSLLTASGNTDAIEVKCMGLGEWNIPEGAKAYIDRMAGGLADSFPALNATISQNAEAFKAEIDKKAAELQSLVVAHNHTGKQVACMEWQMEFVDWLGYDVVTYYGPPEGLSTVDMLNVTGSIEESDILAIIDNLQSGTDFGANVASQTGVTHVIFSNFPGAIPGTDTYLEMIEYNTNQLISGINAQEQQNSDIAALDDEVSSLELQRAALTVATVIFASLAAISTVLYLRRK
jgi:ABC-type Zn uptake system ZnuABC Zn-binding protein ZnuA